MHTQPAKGHAEKKIIPRNAIYLVVTRCYLFHEMLRRAHEIKNCLCMSLHGLRRSLRHSTQYRNPVGKIKPHFDSHFPSKNAGIHLNDLITTKSILAMIIFSISSTELNSTRTYGCRCQVLSIIT